MKTTFHVIIEVIKEEWIHILMLLSILAFVTYILICAYKVMDRLETHNMYTRVYATRVIYLQKEDVLQVKTEYPWWDIVGGLFYEKPVDMYSRLKMSKGKCFEFMVYDNSNRQHAQIIRAKQVSDDICRPYKK